MPELGFNRGRFSAQQGTQGAAAGNRGAFLQSPSFALMISCMKISPLFFHLDEKILSLQSKNLFPTDRALYSSSYAVQYLAMLCTRISQVHQNEEFTKQLSQCRHISVMNKTHLPQAAVGILRLARCWGIVPKGWRLFLFVAMLFFLI